MAWLYSYYSACSWVGKWSKDSLFSALQIWKDKDDKEKRPALKDERPEKSEKINEKERKSELKEKAKEKEKAKDKPRDKEKAKDKPTEETEKDSPAMTWEAGTFLPKSLALIGWKSGVGYSTTVDRRNPAPAGMY